MILGSLIFLAQCGDSSRREVHWHFIIPNQYEGFLAIKYECPGGIPLPGDGNTILVVFRDDGTFCTSDSSFAWRGQETAETRSGHPIPAQGLWGRKGYGFYSNGLLTSWGPPRQQFDIYWVGNLEYLASIRNQKPYADQLAAFLKDRFGIVLPK
jgi:hypothetical protein